jgi:hypothetical protein
MTKLITWVCIIAIVVMFPVIIPFAILGAIWYKKSNDDKNGPPYVREAFYKLGQTDEDRQDPTLEK